MVDNIFVKYVGVRVMVFNAIFNNISVISWQSFLLLEETGALTDMSQVTDKLLTRKVYQDSISQLLW